MSALHRAGPHRVLIALAPGRGSLARLRSRPSVALALLGAGFSVTAEGRAAVVADPVPGAPHVVAVELRAARLRDTLGTRTKIHEGIRWGWRARDAEPGRPIDDDRHAVTLAALARLAAAGPEGTGG